MQRIGVLGRFVVFTAAALGTAVLLPRLALADTGTVVFDCAPPLPIEKAVGSADLVFVGTVASTSNGGRSAIVDVTETWRGDVPTPVIVNGSQDPANLSEDARSFEVGTTYLFLPALSGSGLVDSICSPTTVWQDGLASLRPPNVGKPLATTPSGPGPLAFLGSFAGPIGMAGLIGGGAFGFALLVARRRDA